MQEADDSIIRDRQPITREFIYHPAGGDRTGLMTFFPVFDDMGEVAYFGGMLLDATELYNARVELQQARARLQAFFDHVPVGVFINRIGPGGINDQVVEFANDNAGRPYGLKAAQLVGTRSQDPAGGDVMAATLRRLDGRIEKTGKPVYHEMINPQNGRHEGLSRFPIRSEAGEISHITTYSLRNANITWNVTPLVPDRRIEVDEDQVVQVLINLILNAQQALAEHEADRQVAISAPMSADGAWLTIEVADNGPGVPEALANRIFDPFFTTKSVGQGTGLGLSVCKSMVEAHGGKLSLAVTPGGGATFRVTLPALISQTVAVGDDSGVGGQQKPLGRILIVDDEIEIAAILADCLQPLGIDCVIATDGNSALQRLEEAD